MHSVMIDQLTEPLSDAIMQLQSLKRQLKVKVSANSVIWVKKGSYKLAAKKLNWFCMHSIYFQLFIGNHSVRRL